MTVAEPQTRTSAMTASVLYDALLHNTAPFILDVRNPHDFARWRIEGRAGLTIQNIPYYDFIEDEEGAIARVPAEREVLVVCAREGSSQYVADLLRARGIEARYLEGGILSWGYLYDTRDIVSASWGRIIQVARPARGDVSFIVISDGVAAVIDPLRHTAPYLEAIAPHGARLTHIFDTHVHADHISGGPALNHETGAPYYVHPYDAIHPIDMLPATIAYTALDDGQTYRVGQFELRIIWYPGHTLGQVNILAIAPDGSRYLFTGDGIFLRSFGRPDLGGKGEAWTPLLYESMARRLPPHLDDATLILPSHFSTLDEVDDVGRVTAPWGVVRQTNASLTHLKSEDEFRSFVLGNLPEFPPQYVEIKRVNIGLRTPSEADAEELELGKNVCALAQ
ncbi:MAG: MBL fold metallo-hydrolase [Roseiflexus castenholzii]|uniref:MBL fold metallo-hydrolase n=1 Tax=Roseiflexus castenholzii TaxID=120962 RepID=UPI000CBEEB4B|nr:MAG: MBL fold metallo-hydrolase [Roseiflexus castenholzii]